MSLYTFRRPGLSGRAFHLSHCSPLAIAAALGIAAALPTAARADCVQNGATVTCTGTDPNGFGDGTQNNVTMTIQSGATVTNAANTNVIALGDDNTIVNHGTVTIFGGNGAAGIQSHFTSTITNFGVVTGGDSVFGILGFTGSSIDNRGTVIVGNNATGMRVTINNVVMNNSGTVQAGNNSVAMDMFNNGAMTNTGTVTVGTTGYAMRVGGNSSMSNSGSIVAGVGSAGMGGLTNNVITNSGSIVVAADGVGISATGTSSTVTNSGTVIVGANSVALDVANNSTVTNSGLLKAGAGGVALSWNNTNTVANSGTVDGRILGGTANTVTNSGLITITDAGTPMVVTNHQVGGTFTQTGPGTLSLRVNNAGARDGLVATTANLGGRLQAVLQPGLYAKTTTYTDVVTGAISGTFAQVGTSWAFFTATATYNANSVDLTLNRAAFNAMQGLTPNQQAVGNALETGYATTLTGQAATFYSNLLQAGSTGVLNALSGEGLAASHQAAFYTGGLFNIALTDQVLLWRNGGRNGIVEGGAPLGYAAQRKPTDAFNAITKAPPAAVYQPSWSAWASGFTGRQQLDGGAGTGSAAANLNTAGGALGVDYAFGNVLLGVGAGLSTSSFGVADRATSGDVDGRHIGAYGAVRFGGSYASALVSYGEFDNRTRRTIAGVGLTETASAGFTGEQVGARFEIGHRFVFDRFGVTPFAAVQWSQLRQQGSTESSVTSAGGVGTLGLTVGPRTVESLPFFLGAQVDTTVALTDTMWLSPFVRAAWVHESRPDRALTASFVAVPGASFTVDGARPSSDALKLDAGARLTLTPYAALIASFNGEFGDASTAYAGSAALRVSW